jgi:hypothetical protein
MPPAAQQSIASIVRTLGADTRPEEQRRALAAVAGMCYGQDRSTLAALTGAGAIPALVKLLKAGRTTEVHRIAAGALWDLAESREARGTITCHPDGDAISSAASASIAAAGAIPLLVQLLVPGTPGEVQEVAAGLLCDLALMAENAVDVVTAGAIPRLVQLLAPDSPVQVQRKAAEALSNLAQRTADMETIVGGGAIPRLVQLLGPGFPVEVQRNAANALTNFVEAALDSATISKVTAAGATAPLLQLLGPGTQARAQHAAALTLQTLYHLSDGEALAIKAAGVSDDRLSEILGRRFRSGDNLVREMVHQRSRAM